MQINKIRVESMTSHHLINFLCFFLNNWNLSNSLLHVSTHLKTMVEIQNIISQPGKFLWNQSPQNKEKLFMSAKHPQHFLHQNVIATNKNFLFIRQGMKNSPRYEKNSCFFIDSVSINSKANNPQQKKLSTIYISTWRR